MGSSMVRDDQSQNQDVTEKVPMTHREPRKELSSTKEEEKILTRKAHNYCCYLPVVKIVSK
jgi:hypothetical protein